MADIDQGVLDSLNFILPGCSINRDVARIAKQTGAMKSVPLGQQCPAGYTASHGLPGNNTINRLCEMNNITDAQRIPLEPLLPQLTECLVRAPSAPAPPLVCNYCACPPRVDPGCPPQSIACHADCPVAFTPGIPIVPPTAPAQAPASVPAPVLAPAPAPATKSELPIWAIILIVIAVFGVVGGLVYAGIKMSQ